MIVVVVELRCDSIRCDAMRTLNSEQRAVNGNGNDDAGDERPRRRGDSKRWAQRTDDIANTTAGLVRGA